MKKNVLVTLSLLIVTSLFLSACQTIPFLDKLPFVDIVQGTGEVISETRDVSGFNQVRLNGAGRLIITQGSSESLEIQAEDNIINELTSEVSDNTLILGLEERPWRKQLIPTKVIIYNLTVTDLSDITFNGAGDLEVSALETTSLNVVINGAGQIKIEDLMANDVSVSIAGTGSITISGQVATQTVSIEGAGNYQAGDLQTRSTEIKIAGLGNGTVWAVETLDVTIDGGGSVNYYGSPNVTQEINGVGNINNRGEK